MSTNKCGLLRRLTRGDTRGSERQTEPARHREFPARWVPVISGSRFEGNAANSMVPELLFVTTTLATAVGCGACRRKSSSASWHVKRSRLRPVAKSRRRSRRRRCERNAKRRNAMVDEQHGTRASYGHGCRCFACRGANRRYQEHYRAAKVVGDNRRVRRRETLPLGNVRASAETNVKAIRHRPTRRRRTAASGKPAT